MKKYKSQIEQILLESNWLIIRIDKSDEWWDEEHWLIQYEYNPKILFYLNFIISPMTEGFNNKNATVYKIVASEKRLDSWNDEKYFIASIGMMKNEFANKLHEFISELEGLKK